MKLKLLLLSLAICINQNSLADTKIKMASSEEVDNYLFKNSFFISIMYVVKTYKLYLIYMFN